MVNAAYRFQAADFVQRAMVGRATEGDVALADDELLLYVIHGCLHLVGYDDATAKSKQAMRQAEETYLRQFGLEHRL